MQDKTIFNPTKAHLYRNKPSISKAYQTTEKTSIALISQRPTDKSVSL